MLLQHFKVYNSTNEKLRIDSTGLVVSGGDIDVTNGGLIVSW